MTLNVQLQRTNTAEPLTTSKLKHNVVTVLDGFSEDEPVVPAEVRRPLWEKKLWEYEDGDTIIPLRYQSESMDEARLRLGLIKALPQKAIPETAQQKGNQLPF